MRYHPICRTRTALIHHPFPLQEFKGGNVGKAVCFELSKRQLNLRDMGTETHQDATRPKQ
jgi:hypothetical protein